MIQRLTERELVWLFAFFMVCMLGVLVLLYSASMGHGNTLSAVLNPDTPTATPIASNSTVTATTTATITATTTIHAAGQATTTAGTATLSGYVKGRDGVAMANAYVFLHAGSIVYYTQAGANGYYQFNVDKALPPGSYYIRASTSFPESSGVMSELKAVSLQAGSNSYEVRYSTYPPITTVTTTAATTITTTAEPSTPMASIYVNVCDQYNFALTGISWEKSGTNGRWLPLQATGLRLSGNLSQPTRLNITQFESLGWPDAITIRLAGTDLGCTFNLGLNARLEVNMCTCTITSNPLYTY